MYMRVKMENFTASITTKLLRIQMTTQLIFTLPEASDGHPLDRINKDVCEYSFNKGRLMIIWSIDNKKEYISKYKNWKVWMFGTNSIVV